MFRRSPKQWLDMPRQRCSLHQSHKVERIHHAFAQRCYSSKGGGNADVVMARHWSARLEAKVGARGAGVHMRHLCCSDTFGHTTWILLSLCNCCWHLFIKKCHFITRYVSWCMDDFASSQPKNPCTVVPARYTWASLTECLKDRNVTDMKESSANVSLSTPPTVIMAWNM